MGAGRWEMGVALSGRLRQRRWVLELRSLIFRRPHFPHSPNSELRTPISFKTDRGIIIK